VKTPFTSALRAYLLLAVTTATALAKIEDAKWIWFPEKMGLGSFPAETRYFQTKLEIPEGRRIKKVEFIVTADDRCKIFVNGARVADNKSGWGDLQALDLTRHFKTGTNLLAVEARNARTGPAALLGEVVVTFEKGTPLTITTSGDWQSRRTPAAAWQKARVIGDYGMEPWGRVRSVHAPSAYPSGHLPEIAAQRPLDRSAADNLLEVDWLFQADNNPTIARTAREIGWARDLAKRILNMAQAPDLSAEMAMLDKLEASIDGCSDPKALYLEVRRLKRRIAFSNPVVDFDQILLVDSPYAVMGHGHSGHESGHRNGCQQTGGYDSKLQILEGLSPDGKLTSFLPEGLDAYVWRPDLSFDARKVVFCRKDSDGPAFHLFEVNVDGTGMRQLTRSPHDDLDPVYLPDGRIAFCTTRSHTYVRCLPTSPSFVLARCEADGSNIRIISRNSEPDYLPALLHDGRLVYTRWEYTERPLWRLQGLWTANPDGTSVRVYWGNRSAHPDMLIEPRAIPGTGKVMFIGAGHHKFFAGCIGTVDITKGREFPDGLAKVTADVRWPETGDGPGCAVESDSYHASGRYAAYKSPYPLGPDDFLVSARAGSEGGGNKVRFNEEFSLYLMDIHGNRELVYRGDNNVWYAQPVRKRKAPPIRPDAVDWPKAGEPAKGGVLYSADVYEGVEGLERGEAKYVRVIQMDAKTYSAMAKTWRHSGPTVSIIQEDGVKRFLGTAPIEKDGSVNFRVPSGKALHFQLLDEDHRCLQIMRSFTGVMPGEFRGCVGCHEQRSQTPVAPDSRAIAMQRPPSALTEPPWGADVSISYERFAQPVLDKSCGRCHQGDKNPRAKARLDLALRGGLPERGVPPELSPFKEPYLTLVGPAWNSPVKGDVPGAGIAGCLNVEGTGGRGSHGALQPIAPKTMLSSTSPLIRMVMTGKHPMAQDGSEVNAGIKVSPEDRRRLIAWVDANCVYRGDEEIRQIPDPPSAKVARFPVRPRIKTAPVIDRLQPINDELHR